MTRRKRVRDAVTQADHLRTAAQRLLEERDQCSPADLRRKVQQLQALQWLQQSAAPPPAGPLRWPVVTLFVVTALVLWVLLGTPHKTSVAVDAATGSLELTLAPATAGPSYRTLLASQVPVSSLSLEGAVRMVPASEDLRVESNGAALGAPEWSNLSVEQAYVHALEGSEPAVLLSTEEPGFLRMCVLRGSLVLELRAQDQSVGSVRAMQVHLSPASTEPAALDLAEVCAVLERRGIVEGQLIAGLPVTALNLNGIGYRMSGANEQNDNFPSTLRRARVSFEAVPSAQALLQAAQRLGLKEFSGQLRRVVWEKEALRVGATGSARDVTRATGSIEQSLVPNRLERLRAQYSDVWFAWGVLLYVVGLAITLMKWQGLNL